MYYRTLANHDLQTTRSPPDRITRSRTTAPHGGKAERKGGLSLALTYVPTHRDFREKGCHGPFMASGAYNNVPCFLKANKLTEVILPDERNTYRRSRFTRPMSCARVQGCLLASRSADWLIDGRSQLAQ